MNFLYKLLLKQIRNCEVLFITRAFTICNYLLVFINSASLLVYKLHEGKSKLMFTHVCKAGSACPLKICSPSYSITGSPCLLSGVQVIGAPQIKAGKERDAHKTHKCTSLSLKLHNSFMGPRPSF